MDHLKNLQKTMKPTFWEQLLYRNEWLNLLFFKHSFEFEVLQAFAVISLFQAMSFKAASNPWVCMDLEVLFPNSLKYS